MVERFILLKLRDGDTRAAVAQRVHASLQTLPELSALSVGLPADAASEKSWDVSLVLGFPSADALERALASAPFTTLLEELAHECQVVKAWSFARLQK